jgi:hypothetical protein
MYNKNIRLSIVLLVIILISCNRNNNKQFIKERMGSYLSLPEIKKLLYKDSLYKNNIPLDKTALKITTFIWGDCHVCIKDLKKWEKFYNFAKNNKEVQINFYLYATDIKLFRNTLYPDEIHKFPLIIDQNFQYMEQNNLPQNNKNFQTFLLDSNNKVILIGNPTTNKKLKELYLEEINNRLDRQ